MFELSIGEIKIIAAFAIIVTASSRLALIFQKIKLPLITGFIIVGVIAGSSLLKMLPSDLDKLKFVDDIALAFIAMASGAEIYLKEVRDKMRDIGIMTAAQFFITFIISFFLVMLLASSIPFMANVTQSVKIAISILIATIFIARSPASAIAIINELRAKGPFTKIALGVTILKDIFVIILFAATFSIAGVLINGGHFDFIEIVIVFVAVLASIGLGWVYGKILEINFRINKPDWLNIIVILLIGWSMFGLSDFFAIFSEHKLGTKIHLEALLIGIVASFYITNYSKYRLNLQKLIEDYGAYVYAAFFTLIGATLSVEVLLDYWAIAFLLFGVRLLAVVIASFTGSLILKDDKKKALLSWTPYITQAGVSLGLITLVSANFKSFGTEFEAILIGVIVINQFIGPPLMKWAIINVGEAHTKSTGYEFDYQRDVFIFGIGGKAIMLARTLKEQGYNVVIVTDLQEVDTSSCQAIPIKKIEKITYENLEEINFKTADSVVIFRNEKDAYEISELIYEKYGTPNVIVVLDKHGDLERFKKINVIVVAPTGALIMLLADFVKSPQATSMLLGMQEKRETADIEVLARDVHNKSLRDLQLPLGVLVLSITRHREVLLPHGYTLIRLHDIVTVVGSLDQIEQIRTKLQYN